MAFRVRNLALAAALLASASPLIAQGTAGPTSDTLTRAIAADMPSLMTLYREMHANPELSYQEVQSAARMAREARALGFEVTENVGGHGVVAVLRNGPGPVLMIRADMDGLPVTEATGLPYASTVRATTAAGVETGVMHACGHDTHMTAWIGTARQMVANRAHWSGTLMMIGQPAEEVSGGARAMLGDGLFTRFPHPNVAIAFHDSAAQPAGQIGVTDGYVLANVDSVDIEIHGAGGHGAYPQNTRDPIVLASRIVTSLQTLVSREVDPQDSAVVTVGSFHAGTKHNIIPDSAHLQLTVRSYADTTRRLLLDGIARIARGEAIAAGIPEDRLPEVSVARDDATPSTFNTPQITGAMRALLTSRFGAARVVSAPPSMAGEDFARYYRADNQLQSLIIWVGGVPQATWDAAQANGTTLPSLHSPLWAPDAPKVIATATEAMTAMAMEILKPTGI